MKFTPGPYNANIGPGGPDMNRVGFKRVQAYMKAKMSPYMAADQASAVPQTGNVPLAQPITAPTPIVPMPAKGFV